MIRHWYHFTDRSNVLSILREGLKPRGKRPANYHGEGLDSNPNYVYLTSRVLRPWHGMDYDSTALLVIDPAFLNDDLMRPDEDEGKFGTTGTAAYEGVIDPEAIVDVQFFLPVEDERGSTEYVRLSQDFIDWL